MSEPVYDKYEDRFYTQDGDDVIWFDTLREAREFTIRRQTEREIVAWLRAKDFGASNWFAEAIERGEYRK